LIFNGLLFCSGFAVALQFYAIFLKTCDNKTNPRINSLIFNTLQTSLKRLIFNGFTHFNGAGRVGQG
jgi:hypothetical protein